MILVSVIAADFTEEYDFTSIPTFKPMRPSAIQEPSPEEAPVSEGGEEEASPASQILPNFLKGKK